MSGVTQPQPQPLVLCGDAFARGLAQAGLASESAEPVRTAVALRLAEVRGALAGPPVRDFLAAQRAFTAATAPEAWDETAGIARGFGIPADDLFAYLHLGVIADIARGDTGRDGCTAWAIRHPEHGTVLGKNRDFRGEHVGLQRLFRHHDPAWSGREVLCVGSLGSPGAYSSGINSDGLAIADTAVATRDHGPGWLRYFLMTRLLATCATVATALDAIRRAPQAGGGTLVLADPSGALAAVELGHRRTGIEIAAESVARTNHFTGSDLADANFAATDTGMADSRARLATIRAALAFGFASTREAAAAMAGHGGPVGAALCRHPEGEGSRTISAAIFTTHERTLHFADGQPCVAAWVRAGLGRTAAA